MHFSSFDGLIKQGATGSEVKAIQAKLKELGFYFSTPNGIYDGQMLVSVLNFQKSRGLKQDGIIGPQTQVALSIKSYVAPVKPSTYLPQLKTTLAPTPVVEGEVAKVEVPTKESSPNEFLAAHKKELLMGAGALLAVALLLE